MADDPIDISPEEETRIVSETQAILDGSGLQFKVTGITARSVGVMGDARTHQHGLVITPQNVEACSTELQQQLGTKIINEVQGVNRATFEIPLSL